jgi:hypothetical protein
VPEKSLWLEVLVQTKSIGWLWNDFCSELTLGHPLSSIVSSCNHKVSCMALCTNQLSKKNTKWGKTSNPWWMTLVTVCCFPQHFFCLSGDTIWYSMPLVEGSDQFIEMNEIHRCLLLHLYAKDWGPYFLRNSTRILTDKHCCLKPALAHRLRIWKHNVRNSRHLVGG